jgi:hypothetical protein
MAFRLRALRGRFAFRVYKRKGAVPRLIRSFDSGVEHVREFTKILDQQFTKRQAFVGGFPLTANIG